MIEGNKLKNLNLKRIRRKIKPETILWIKSGYSMPSPFQVKIATLDRHCEKNSDWIETGTYLAETTVCLAKKHNLCKIYTIEPAKEIFQYSQAKYSRIKNIEFLNGSSEDLFETTLLKTEGKLNLWLDGHYSGDITFKGELDSPIVHELETLSKHITRFENLAVFVDDFRLFGKSKGYPEASFLTTWAESNNMDWTVEHDIFIAKKTGLRAPN